MKKIFVCMVSVVMFAVLTACGNKVREDREQPAGTERTAMSTDMEPGTDHDVLQAEILEVFGDGDVTVTFSLD